MSDTTAHLQIPKPNAAHVPPVNIADEFLRLRQAWDMVDLFLHELALLVDQKADDDHEHAMSAITGLVEALNAKMPADRQFKLDDLTDVSGADAAAVNYVLVKAASGGWVPSTALAALGIHQHLISEVTGLAAALTDRPTRSEVEEALDILNDDLLEAMVAKTGSVLAGGFTATSKNLGAPGASTTITPAGGNIQHLSNVGAIAITAPSVAGVYTILLEIINSATAGAVTLSGFSLVDGDTFTTTSGHAFHVHIAKTNGKVAATVKALQ